MSHETFHELIALRLYGEIDAEERRRLDEHLRGCAECGRFADEFESGLGRIPRGAPELGLPPRRRALPWWTVAASFAAGAVATAVIARGPSTPDPASGLPSTWERFHREEPPPLASTEGQLGRLTEYLRR